MSPAAATNDVSMIITVNCPPLFVVICFVISFLGCYTATQLTEQIRISRTQPSRLVGSKTMFLLHSLAFAGVSAWIMHIISLATSVFTLPDQTAMNVDVKFASGMTSLSLLLVLITTLLGNNTPRHLTNTSSFNKLLHNLMHQPRTFTSLTIKYLTPSHTH